MSDKAKRTTFARYKHEFLRAELRKRGITAAYFRAILKKNECGINVEKLLRGERNPSGAAAALIARLLDIPLERFYAVQIKRSYANCVKDIGPVVKRGRPLVIRKR